MKLSVGQRILIGLGIVELLALGLGVFTLYKTYRARQIEFMLKMRDFEVLRTLHDVSNKQRSVHLLRERTVTQYLHRKAPPLAGAEALKGDPAKTRDEWSDLHGKMSATLTALQAETTKYARVAASPERGKQWARITENARQAEEARKALQEAAVALFDLLAQEKQNDHIAGAIAQVESRRIAFDQKLLDEIKLVDGVTEIGNEISLETYNTTMISASVGLVLMLVLGALAGLFVQRSITQPLGQFMLFAEQVGQGDLTSKAPDSGVRDLARLGESLDSMVAGLRGLAGQISAVTQDLNGASAEILASVQQTAAGTREQAAAVQEITATVEEVSQSGGQISERARQVATSAEATATTTAVGLQAVVVATSSMESIRQQVEAFVEQVIALSEKTQAVGEIVSAVTDVAERSNLLALNAAIEAAGAGEHGARFAVVAAEMKNLADQAKESTVQVQSILSGIQKGISGAVMLTEEAVKRADAGREQAETTERVIREMAETTQQSVHAFQQIIAATNQQQIGLEQITQGMRDVRQAASQTATATTQLEAAAANVTGLSRQLQEAVGRYRL